MSNHLGDTNKMVVEDVSNEQMTAQATPNEELRRQILSHCVAKNEREWWASRTIEKLERELNAANERIKRLEEAGDALCIAALYTGWVEKVEAWTKSKEAKP